MSTCFGRKAAFLALGLVAALAPGLAAASEVSVGLAYRFYVGSVKVGKATVTANFAGDSYWIKAAASTTGAAGFMFDAEMTMRAEGVIADGVAQPAVFTLDMTGGKKPQDVTVRYLGNRPDEIFAEPPFQKRSYEIDPKRQLDTVDPLSAGILAVLTASRRGGDVCRLTMPIFDGRRRYDLVLEGREDTGRDRGQPTVDCRARFRRLGGFKPKHMRLPDYTFVVRARIRPDGIAIPLRAWGDTPFGSAIATIRD